MITPANLQIEQGIIGTLLIDPRHIHAAQMLTSGDFYWTEHAQIFSLITAAAAEGRALSPATLAPQIGDLRFGDMNAGTYLIKLVGSCADPVMLPEYIAAVRELAARRAMIALADSIKNFAEAPKGALAPFVGDTIATLDAISAALRSKRQSMHHAGDLALQTVENLKSGKKPESISTGLRDLDRITGGWHRRELAVIAGRPSMGKSAFALSTLRLAAMHGATSLFFSLEMQDEAVSMRLLSDGVFNRQTPIPYSRMDQRKVDEHELNRLHSVSEDLLNLPMHIDTQRGLSVAEIGARARRKRDELERNGQRLDLICVDHLGKVQSSDRYAGNKVHETGEKTNALANLAGELDVAVIALTQLNRGVEGRDDKRPGMSDLRDSGNIEEDADTVSFLYRPAYYLERTKIDDPEKDEKRLNMLEIKRNTLELIVSKNRRGPICTQEFFIDVASNVVRDRV